MDEIDRQLIALLRDNARTPVATLAKRPRVARGTVQNRLARLEKDGVIVGYLVCSRYDTVWHLMNVAVEPARQRQGIASALLVRLFEEGDRPSEQYTLEVRTSNEGAIRMYERFGFRAAGRRRGYYHDNREDALIMWRTVGERTTA